MASNVCTPYYEPGGRVTGRATGAAVVGKRFVALAQKKDLGSRELDSAASGGNIRIVQAAADDAKCFGVAEYDAADGATTTILRGGFIVPMTCGVILAAGDLVKPGAGGKAVKTTAGTDIVRGISLSDSVVDGDAIIALYA
jgi:hypothetical protein